MTESKQYQQASSNKNENFLLDKNENETSFLGKNKTENLNTYSYMHTQREVSIYIWYLCLCTNPTISTGRVDLDELDVGIVRVRFGRRVRGHSLSSIWRIRVLANQNCCVRPDQLLIRVEGLIRKLRIWIKKTVSEYQGIQICGEGKNSRKVGRGRSRSV